MIDVILGEKLGMTQVFVENGDAVPVTVLSVGPCTVVQIKTEASDGYDAVQVGYVEKEEKNVNKPQMGHFTKNGLKPFRHLKEVRGVFEEVEVGKTYGAEILENSKEVFVIGNSKGKGFAGVMKRHNFAGGPAGHGSNFHRRPGSIGASAYPSRVMKGTKMAGRMGNDRVTVKGLEVVKVDGEKNLVFIKGGVPGPNGSIVMIKKSC